MIVDSGDHASILDGCLLSRAKMRPFRHNRLEKLEKMLDRAQGDGGGVLVVVDGVFSMEGDIAPLHEIAELCGRYGARLMVDEAHGAGVLGRSAPAPANCSASPTGSTCGWAPSPSRWPPAAASSPAPAEVIDYLRIASRAFLFTASAVPAAVGAALAALRVTRSEDGRALLEAVLENALRLRDGLEEIGYAAVRPADPLAGRRGPGERPGCPHRRRGELSIVTPIVPVLVGDDWKAALLWKALYDAGVFVNTALHPAVPPGGALLRTSVMATHDAATIDRSLEIFAAVKRAFEAEHGPLPGPLTD